MRDLQAVLSRPPSFRLERVMWAAGQLLSFETAFLLFLFAAVYKTDPRFAWFPGDMTLVFFGISVIAAFVPLLRGGLFYLPGIKAVCAGATLVLWIAASRLWTPSEIYAQEKTTLIVTVNLWCLIATAMIISSSRTRAWRFLGLLLVFGGLASIDQTLTAATAPDIGWMMDHYLIVGRLSGLAALVAFVLWLHSPPLSAAGLFFLTNFAVCGYVLLVGGGRGPSAAVAFAMLVPPLLSLRLPHGQLVINRRILSSLGLVAALGVIIAYLAVSGDGSVRTLRKFDLLMNEGGKSALNRFDFWRHALTYWAERPIVGHGVGAFPMLYFGQDLHRYPHNFILEMLSEFGLIGLGLFASLVLILVRRVSLRRLREDPLLMCATMLCINAFMNAMSSGDIADNRNVFAMLGLLALARPVAVGSKGRSPELNAPGRRPSDLLLEHVGRRAQPAAEINPGLERHTKGLG